MLSASRIAAVFFLCSIIYFGCGKGSSDNPPGQETVILSVYPTKAKGGETITISGKNLLKDSIELKVFLNNVQASILSSSNEIITFKVPQRVGSGKVKIVAGGQAYDGPEFTYDYVVVVSTIAGNGFEGNSDGIGTSASFKFPFGITVDNNGDLYIADCYNRLIRKIDTATRRVSTIDIPLVVRSVSSFFFRPTKNN